MEHNNPNEPIKGLQSSFKRLAPGKHVLRRRNMGQSHNLMVVQHHNTETLPLLSPTVHTQEGK